MKYFIFIILFCSFSSLANTAEVSKRLTVTYDDSVIAGNITFENQYMTNYIARFIDKDGQSGQRLYITPNNKKVDFDIADAEIVNYGLKINGKLPTFNSVETNKNVFNGFVALDSDKKNYDIHITGGGILGLLSIGSVERSADFLSSERALDADVKMAFFLNMLTMTELGSGIIDNITFAADTDKKVGALKELVELAQNTQQVSKNISFYYALAKAMVNQIESVAEYMGGMENGVPKNEILAQMLGQYNNTVYLMDRLVSVTDKLAGMQVGDEVVKDWEAKFQEASKKRLSDLSGVIVTDYQTDIAEEYSKVDGNETAILTFVENMVLVPSVAILSAYTAKLKLDYKASSGTAKEDLKLQIQVVTATKGLLQIYSLFMDSAELISVLKSDPEEGKRIIGTMSYDIAESVAAYYLLNVDVIQDLGVEYILKNHGKAAAKKANIYAKAFNASKDVANVLLPFLSDFALSPARLQTSLINGQLSRLDPLMYKVEIANGQSVYTYEDIANNETLDIFVDVKSSINFSLYLNRPDYFNEQKVPWKLNAGTSPQTIYNVEVLVDRANAQRKTLCVKKVAYNEEFVFYDFDVDSTYKAFAGECDAGEWGIADGPWFDGDIAGPFDNFELYDSDDEMSEMVKLNNFDSPIISLPLYWDNSNIQKDILTIVRGYDLNNNHWNFIFHPKIAEDNFVFTLSSDENYLTSLTIENHFDSFSEQVEYYSVNFGDGFVRVIGNSIDHTYTSPGTYTVKINIKTLKGQELAVSRDIIIEVPVSYAKDSLFSNVDTTFTIEDLNNQITSVTWDFGDGTIVENSNLLYIEHAFSDAGDYQLVLTITTQDGRSFEQIVNVTVLQPPLQQFSADSSTVKVNEPVLFSFDFERTNCSLNFGNGFQQQLQSCRGEYAYEFPKEYVYRVKLMSGAEELGAIGITVQNFDDNWIGYEFSIRVHRPNFSINNIQNDGRLYASPDLMVRSGYWTNFRFIKPNLLDVVNGDNFILEARIKNPMEEGGISCFDPGLSVLGETGYRASVVFMQEGCTYYASIGAVESFDHGNNTDLTALGRDFSEWRNVKLVVENNSVTAYFDGEFVYSKPCEGSIGIIQGLAFSFKGSGSIDWVRLYDGNGQLKYSNDFD